MAKTSSVVKNEQRKRLVELHRARRDELRKRSKDIRLTPEERWEAQVKLAKMPRDASPVRIRNRCVLTGRPRGFLRKFQMSRLSVRELALEGKLPGVTKASW